MPDAAPSTATPPAYPPMGFPPAVVAIRPVGGLASRLKCIASFAVLAGHFGVPLHVCWGPSPSFEDVAWSTLFDSDAPLPFAVEWLDAAQWQALRATKGVLKLEAFVSYLLTDYKHPFTDLKPIFQTRRPQRLTAECNRELSSVYSGVLHGVVPGFTANLREYWGAFVPALGVREVVAAEVDGWTAAGATDVLGIHVRRNDALQSRLGRRYTKPTDAEVVALIAGQLAKNGGKDARDITENNTDDADGDADDAAVDAPTDAPTDAPATHHAFVATDDPGVAAAVNAAYGDDPRVHLYPWRRYPQKHGAPVAGQAKALADLYTLRCCDRVVGTAFSVFTQMAQQTARLDRATVAITYVPLFAAKHGLVAAAWDAEPEPPHVVAAREAKAQAQSAETRKVAAAVVQEVVDTVVRRLAPTPPAEGDAAPTEQRATTAAPVATPPPPAFPVGAHVALVGPSQPQWRGRRGVCLGATDGGAMRVVVDADQGVVVEVSGGELVGVAAAAAASGTGDSTAAAAAAHKTAAA